MPFWIECDGTMAVDGNRVAFPLANSHASHRSISRFRRRRHPRQVMSHAVSAMVGEDNLCLPTAGIIASTLMFALSQLRTMANLGRGVSAASLAALLVVVAQCLHALRAGANDPEDEAEERESHADVALAKMGSLASVCFANGSQKLLLNVRHAMADRSEAAPGALSVALAAYGAAYVAVCVAAGPRPPSFLFDAVPPGLGRRVGGLLLWVHVAVR